MPLVSPGLSDLWCNHFTKVAQPTGISYLHLQWNRISFSKLTIIYFCFSVAHFVIQLSLQIRAFTINADASNFLSKIVNEAHTTNNSLPFLDGPILRMCSWVPSNLNVDVASCPVVWNGTAAAANANTPLNPLNNIAALTSTDVSSTLSSSISSSAYSASSTASLSSSIPTSSVVSTASTTTTQAHQTQTITVFVSPQVTGAPIKNAAPFGNDADDEEDENAEDPFKVRANFIPSG